MENTFKIRDTRRKGFFTIDNEFLDIAKELGGTATLVYLYLCKCSDKNQESFPSQQTMAEKLGIHTDTIIDKINILEKFNLIKVEQTKETGTGKWLHNTYTLLDKTVWGKHLHGSHVDKTSVRVEANTVQINSDTNNTHILTKPIGKKSTNGITNEEILKAREIRHANKQPYKRNLQTYDKTNYKKRGGVADGRGIV